MKPFSLFVILLFVLLPAGLFAQEITYSDFNSEDSRDMNFEILGKMNGGYIIYKNIKPRHFLAVFDDEMKIKHTIKLDFVPVKTINIDFISYSDHFYMIYQFEKNKIVYCMGAKIDAEGKILSEPIQLDTTKVNIFDDNKIYNTIYSQDKKKILVYKMHKKKETLTIATKLFDNDLKLIDSTRTLVDFDSRKDSYSEMLVDNEGDFVYVKQSKKIFSDDYDGLDIVCRKPGTANNKVINVDLYKNYLEDASIKFDNLNRHIILNSFYYSEKRGNIKGLYTMLLDAKVMDSIRSAYNEFPDDLRDHINTDGRFKTAFNDLVIQKSIVKKDGGFILATEDNTVQTRSNNNNDWNRSTYPYSSPYTSNEYYLSNPAYGYYRPFNSFNNWQTTRYYYENILILSLNSNLRIEWNSIIPKSQSDDDNDNFLSFSIMNVGAEIHFLFNEGNRDRQIISNQSILPSGELKRYPTLKSREAGYEFMPRHAKQVGSREVIIPCILRKNVVFAKVIFPE